MLRRQAPRTTTARCGALPQGGDLQGQGLLIVGRAPDMEHAHPTGMRRCPRPKTPAESPERGLGFRRGTPSTATCICRAVSAVRRVHGTSMVVLLLLAGSGCATKGWIQEVLRCVTVATAKNAIRFTE